MEGPGTWLPPENVLPFPDCSVAALSSVISIPTDLTLSVVTAREEEEEATLCDDSFFLKQVSSTNSKYEKEKCFYSKGC